MSELDKLEKYLREHNCDYERIEEPRSEVNLLGMAIDWSRHQIVVYKNFAYSWDAICQHGSYGFQEGLLEISGSIVDPNKDGDVVVGWLTAEQVIERLEGKREKHTGRPQ